MKDESKTKAQLIDELVRSREEISRLRSLKGRGGQGLPDIEEDRQKYVKILDTLNDGVLVAEAESKKFIFANMTICRMLGYDKLELLSLGVQDIHRKQDLPDAIQQFERLVVEEHALAKDIPVMRKDGELFYADISAALIILNGKKYLIGVFRDITERRRAEKVLMDSLKRHKALFENMLSGAAYHQVVLDEDGRPVDYIFLEVNEAFENFTGLRKEDVIGKRVTEAIPGIKDSTPDLISLYGEIALTGNGRIFDLYFAPFDKWYSVSAYCPEKGFFVSTFFDITERKLAEEKLRKSKLELEEKVRERTLDLAETNVALQAEISERKQNEEALRASEQRLRAAQVVGNIGSWERNLLTNELTWSEQVYRLLGLQPNEISPSFDIYLGFVHPEDRAAVKKAAKEALFENKPYDIEYRVITKGGEERVFHSLGQIDRNDEGKPVLIRGVILCITERKRAEEERERLQAQLIEAQKMEAIGTLAGGVAHDFNNILTAIKNFVSLALQSSAGKRQEEYLQPVLEASERGANLVQQLLVFSQRKQFKLASVDLNDVIDDIFNMLRTLLGDGISVVKTFEDKLWKIKADRGRMEQVLTNLIINAGHAMPDGGTVVLRTENVTLNEKQTGPMQGVAPGRFVRLTVEDTGTGIERDVMEHIFEPFFTTRAPMGTGLGLSVVYGIVKELGGYIDVASEPGRGASFMVYLPASDEAEETTA